MTTEELRKNLAEINDSLYLATAGDRPLSIWYYGPRYDERIKLNLYSFQDHRFIKATIAMVLLKEEIIDLIELLYEYEFNESRDADTSNPFKNFTDRLAKTLLEKNNAYGDSFTKSVDKYGLSVIGVRLSDKYNRIEHLITNKEFKENDESLEDTLLDMAGYSILALKYLKEHEDERKD